jgi:hypothetical protein
VRTSKHIWFKGTCQGASWCDGEGTEHMHHT